MLFIVHAVVQVGMLKLLSQNKDIGHQKFTVQVILLVKHDFAVIT